MTSRPLSSDTIESLIRLLWGPEVNHDIFQRWNQGFAFADDDEPTALLQYDGGPCAVIVPVQAFFIKNLLFSESSVPANWRQISGFMRNEKLYSAVADILYQAADNPQDPVAFCELTSENLDCTSETSAAESDCLADDANSKSPSECNTASDIESVVTVAQEATRIAAKRLRLGHEQFHNNLRQRNVSSRNELLNILRQKQNSLSSDFGVLLFLYSLLLTKGLQRIKNDIADLDEPLIDPVHGHGSQSLINLLLTGKAVSHVWDNEKTVSGLKLQGIAAKSDIGFLTLLEHLRYCEVGWYLKNPKYPIWLLGSETHLTVLFSLDKAIVNAENEESYVRQMFNQFDEESRGFIAVESLGELMKQLDLVTVPEYVKLMADKLDPEQLGVITFDSFVAEFFPELFMAPTNNAVRPFIVYHYNGLKRSSKVNYAEGTCTVPDLPELQMISDYSPIKTCLMTKWPTIELSWLNNSVPSLN